MPISSKSRDVVRLEYARAASELAKSCRRDIEHIRITMPPGGAVQAAVNQRHVQCVRESLTSLRNSYVRAYEQEDVDLTAADIDEIEREMRQGVEGLWRARAELEPRSVGIGFREALDQGVREQRLELVLAMKRMQRDRAFPRRTDVAARQVYNVSGPNARVNINSTDSSVNVVTVASSQLFANLRSTIDQEIAPGRKHDELLGLVDELEKAQNKPEFSQSVSTVHRRTRRPHYGFSGIPARSLSAHVVNQATATPYPG
jgi:hypothetical protein